MHAQQIVNGLMLGSVYVFVGIAFTMIIGIINFVNFSIPALFMLGAMTAWALLNVGVLAPVALVAGLLAGIIASMAVEQVLYKRLSGRDPVISLIGSLAFLILYEHLVIHILGSDQQAFPALLPDFNIRFGDIVVGLGQLCGFAISILLVVGLSYLLKHTPIGRNLRAISESTETATILGINVRRHVQMMFVAVGLFTALGGLLFSLNYLQVSALMGQEIGLKAIAAMIIGGVGSIWGAVVGGMLIGILEVTTIGLFSADTVDIVIYSLLLLLLVVRPSGILGGALQSTQRI